MSYVEHGPRIFLAGIPKSGMPLSYGDYVLPRKRLEGRLKLYDSCSDIRAWSPNSLENSRYFRELSEHDAPAGKIIPFKVVVDNIIQLNSQVQNELQFIKIELQKYKSLKLTSEQEKQLQNLDNNQKAKESLQKYNYLLGSLLKETFINNSKSVPIIHSNSYLSVHIPPERRFQSNKNCKASSTDQINQLYSNTFTTFDVNQSPNNCNLTPSFKSTAKTFLNGDYSEKSSSWIEYNDVAIQVKAEICDAGVQFDGRVNKCLNKIITAAPETSLIYKSSNEENSITLTDKSSLHASNLEEQSSECDASCSQSSQDLGILSKFDNDTLSDSDSDTHSSTHKGIIIQKDSEIIVLKNEIYVRDAELEELHDMNKNLEVSLNEKEKCVNTLQENVKILHEKLIKLERQRGCEVEELEKKLYNFKYLIGQFQQELNKNREYCYLQAQEIEKLRLCATQVTTLQLEKATLLKKLQDMDQLSKKVDNYNLALEELRNVLQEKEELKKQCQKQSCMLADQDGKINQLMILLKEKSVAYNEQVEMKNMLENVKTELCEKNSKVCQYEKQLISTKKEISDFFMNLKHILNNIEEFNDSCEDVCNCPTCDLNIGEEANSVLYNVNVVMTRFQSYKIERQNFLQQIEDLKDCINTDKQQVYLNRNLRNIISEEFYYESEGAPRNTSDEDSMVVLNIKQNKNDTSKTELEDVSDSLNSENSLNGANNNFDCHELNNEYHNCIIELNNRDSVDSIEKEIIEYVTYFLIKMHYLMKKFEGYIESERPSIIKQIYNFYEILKETKSTINASQDIKLRKQRISELRNQYREEYEKCKTFDQLPTDLSEIPIKINEFIEAILCQLLNKICVEKNHLDDNQINQALETYLKSCIGRLNIALKGAGDHSAQMIGEIEKQQEELQKKDSVIAELKKEVAQHLVRKGEGDCRLQEESNKRLTVEQELSKVTTELNEKDVHVIKLRDQLQMIQNQLSNYDKDCNVLRKENKNLNNTKNRLHKECQQHKEEIKVKNMDIENLSQQLEKLTELKKLKTIMESKIAEMEKRLLDIERENNELKNKVQHTNDIISKKNKSISSLKDNITKSENNFSCTVVDYNNKIEEKHNEVLKLTEENNILNAKLKDAENKLTEMNETILSLTEQNDKINIIYMLQEDLAKLDKNERKLKTELNNLKMQLANDQNNNKKLDNNLDTFLRENENLQKSVEYWKNENSELSTKLCNEVAEEKLRNKLYYLSNKIYERLFALKEQPELEMQQSNEKIYHSEKEFPINSTDGNFKSNFEYERKENEVEVEKVELINDTIVRKIIGNDYTTFEQLNCSTNNTVQMEYEIKHLQTEYRTSQNEIEKLLNEVEIRNADVRHLKETMSHLAQENTELHDILKSQIEEYQDKLTLMKKNYNSSLNALCERHKESVEILQQRFEDTMKGERTFDSENWLQSLSIKELAELYERISIIIDSKSNLIHQNDQNQYLCATDVDKDICREINEAENKMKNSEKNMYKIERNSSNLHQWPFTPSIQVQKYPVLQTQDFKSCLDGNFRCPDNERKPLEVKNKCGKEKQVVKDNAFDHQRWNFINQCSTYHRLSNTFDYSRSVPTD